MEAEKQAGKTEWPENDVVLGWAKDSYVGGEPLMILDDQ